VVLPHLALCEFAPAFPAGAPGLGELFGESSDPLGKIARRVEPGGVKAVRADA